MSILNSVSICAVSFIRNIFLVLPLKVKPAQCSRLSSSVTTSRKAFWSLHPKAGESAPSLCFHINLHITHHLPLFIVIIYLLASYVNSEWVSKSGSPTINLSGHLLEIRALGLHSRPNE